MLPQRSPAHQVVRGSGALKHLHLEDVTMSSLAYLPQYALDAVLSPTCKASIELRYQDIDSSPDEAGGLCPVILQVDDSFHKLCWEYHACVCAVHITCC
jgi:hypothetical protein